MHVQRHVPVERAGLNTLAWTFMNAGNPQPFTCADCFESTVVARVLPDAGHRYQPGPPLSMKGKVDGPKRRGCRPEEPTETAAGLAGVGRDRAGHRRWRADLRRFGVAGGDHRGSSSGGAVVHGAPALLKRSGGLPIS